MCDAYLALDRLQYTAEPTSILSFSAWRSARKPQNIHYYQLFTPDSANGDFVVSEVIL